LSDELPGHQSATVTPDDIDIGAQGSSAACVGACPYEDRIVVRKMPRNSGPLAARAPGDPQISPRHRPNEATAVGTAHLQRHFFQLAGVLIERFGR
jgi:hypothetical protein